jgi:Leucine-rich repeat (LRR) protein
VFSKYANWCTAREGNGMFKNYTENYKTPDNKFSKLYVIINNKFFDGESDEIFQIHFETNQLKDRKNGQNVSIFENVISESEGVANFFKEELTKYAKMKKTIKQNSYLDYLLKFGFAETLFELLEEDTPIIKFMDREIPMIPNVSKFKNLDQIIITGAKLKELHPSIGDLEKLCLLVLTNNNLTALPAEIGKLKSLEFLNIKGNGIKSIPNEISKLDKTNGGSLYRIVVDEKTIGVENYNKLKTLLPTTNFS